MSDFIKAGEIAKLIPPYYENHEDGSSKFWELGWLNETSWTTAWGRTGTKGSEKTKSFSSKWDAQDAAYAIVQSKINKGYRKVTRPLYRQNIVVEGFKDDGLCMVVEVNGNRITVVAADGTLKVFARDTLQSVPNNAEVV
jgi:predicted DNA-binding WGR domain protein